MIIELNEPFKSKWKKGYLRTSKDKRKRVDLFNTNQDRTSISYSRYLMSVKENRELSSNEEVDHKDGDCTNDDIDNLQILTKDEHFLKTGKEFSSKKSFTHLKCDLCNKDFKRETRNVHKTNFISCSRSCSAKLNKTYRENIKNESKN